MKPNKLAELFITRMIEKMLPYFVSSSLGKNGLIMILPFNLGSTREGCMPFAAGI